MASRTITLNVVGDSSRAQHAIDQVASKGESGAKRMHAAFSSVLGTLNSTGVLGPFGGALDSLLGSLDQIEKKGKSIGKVMLGAGAIGAGVGGALTAAAGPETEAKAQLTAAISAVGDSYTDYADKIEKAVKAEEKHAHTGAETQQALALLTEGLHDPTKALGELSFASDLAARSHVSLSEGATQALKILGGHGTKILVQLGIAHTDTAKAARDLAAAEKEAAASDDGVAKARQKLADLETIDAGKKKLSTADEFKLRDAKLAVTIAIEKQRKAHVTLRDAQDANTKATSGLTDAQKAAKVVHGQADAAVAGFTGHLKIWRTHIEDAAASLGQKYGPALMGASAGMSLLGGATQAAGPIMNFAKVSILGMAAAEDTEAVSGAAALLPIIGIGIAVAALGVGIYELVKHWHAVWDGIKTAAVGAWHFLDHTFHAIADAVKTHTTVIAGALLVLGGPIGLVIGAALLLWRHWKTIWGDIKGIVTGLPSFFTKTFEDIGKGIANGFIWGINKIIDGWDAFVGLLKIPKIHIPGTNINFGGWDPGGALHISEIPYLGEGGIAWGPTLAVVGEKGPEKITPLNRADGGDINIQVTFEQPVFGDMHKVADTLTERIRDNLLRMGRGLPNLGLA